MTVDKLAETAPGLHNVPDGRYEQDSLQGTAPALSLAQTQVLDQLGTAGMIKHSLS